MKRIVALVDHSIYAHSVCDHAAWLASAGGANVDVVHIISPFNLNAMQAASMAGLAVGGPGLIGTVARHSDQRMEELTINGQRLVDRMTSRLAPQTGVTLGKVLVGEMPTLLKTLDEEADIIVVGKRGENADFVNLSLGSNLEGIVRATRSPLLMAPRVFRPVSGWVLAFGMGPEIAEGTRRIASGDLMPKLPCELLYVGKPDAQTRSEMQSAQTILSDGGFTTSINIVDGKPVQTIAERMASDDVQLIAIGGFNRTRLLPAILGDGLATDLTKASLAPVLLLR
jgi:nucleotide-binding universal stress UspA family protein